MTSTSPTPGTDDAVKTVTLPSGAEITVYWSDALGVWVTIPEDDE